MFCARATGKSDTPASNIGAMYGHLSVDMIVFLECEAGIHCTK
jgi:uncharacterized membrane protein